MSSIRKRKTAIAFLLLGIVSCKEQKQVEEQVAPEVMTVSVIQKTVPVYGWFSSNKIKNIKLWPATRKFFEQYVWK